jgi:hypothetical protein
VSVTIVKATPSANATTTVKQMSTFHTHRRNRLTKKILRLLMRPTFLSETRQNCTFGIRCCP